VGAGVGVGLDVGEEPAAVGAAEQQRVFAAAQALVLGGRQDAQIVRAVVGLVAVNVVHMLGLGEQATEDALDDDAVEVASTAAHSDPAVAASVEHALKEWGSRNPGSRRGWTRSRRAILEVANGALEVGASQGHEGAAAPPLN